MKLAKNKGKDKSSVFMNKVEFAHKVLYVHGCIFLWVFFLQLYILMSR